MKALSAGDTSIVRFTIASIISECKICFNDIMGRFAKMKPATIHSVGHCLVCQNICESIYRYDNGILCRACSQQVMDMVMDYYGRGLLTVDAVPITQDDLEQMHAQMYKCRARAYRAVAYMCIYKCMRAAERTTIFQATCNCCNNYTLTSVRYIWTDQNDLHSLHPAQHTHDVCAYCDTRIQDDVQMVSARAAVMIFAGRFMNCAIHDDIRVAVLEQIRAVICGDVVSVLYPRITII